MRQFMMTVTALAAFGAMAVTTQAEVLHGGPAKNGNQCFKYSTGADAKDGRFGTWGSCPQAASTRPTAPQLMPSDLAKGPDRQGIGTH